MNDGFDQKTALFIADSLDICERLNEINQKILKQLETGIDFSEELTQPKHLFDGQGSAEGSYNSEDQAIPERQKQHDRDLKVVYILLPSCFFQNNGSS